MGDMPLMTSNGTFIVNGTERVIVSPDAPLAGRVLRPRQGQEPFVGQAAVRRPDHPVSRLLARHRVRRQGHRLCAHRPPPQDAGDVAAVRARHGRRGNLSPSTRPIDRFARRRELAHAVRRRAPEGREGRRSTSTPIRRSGRRAGQKLTARSARQLAEKGVKALRVADEDLFWASICGGRSRRSEHRRNLRRSGRRDHRKDAAGAARARLRRTADPRHRPHQRRPTSATR